jgi:hypothetical protein
LTAQEQYEKASKRGEFQWEVIEAGTYGESNTVDVEETILQGRVGKVTRRSSKEFESEVDNLSNYPFYDCNVFSSRSSARNWCERLIRKDVKNEQGKV